MYQEIPTHRKAEAAEAFGLAYGQTRVPMLISLLSSVLVRRHGDVDRVKGLSRVAMFVRGTTSHVIMNETMVVVLITSIMG